MSYEHQRQKKKFQPHIVFFVLSNTTQFFIVKQQLVDTAFHNP